MVNKDEETKTYCIICSFNNMLVVAQKLWQILKCICDNIHDQNGSDFLTALTSAFDLNSNKGFAESARKVEQLHHIYEEERCYQMEKRYIVLISISQVLCDCWFCTQWLIACVNYNCYKTVSTSNLPLFITSWYYYSFIVEHLEQYFSINFNILTLILLLIFYLKWLEYSDLLHQGLHRMRLFLTIRHIWRWSWVQEEIAFYKGTIVKETRKNIS